MGSDFPAQWNMEIVSMTGMMTHKMFLPMMLIDWRIWRFLLRDLRIILLSTTSAWVENG
jgi:hypothetical protein